MPTKAVIGVQWGDEGKGKLIDIYASQSDVVVRAQGGNNAGHTVVKEDGEVFKLHLIPSGILYPQVHNLVGSGVVIDPASFLGEIDALEARGVSCANLKLDARAHVVMPWHLLLDGLAEEARGAEDIGTTRRGIGPCYTDKAERSGLRVSDLLHEDRLERRILSVGMQKNEIITKIYGHEPLDLDQILADYKAFGQRLAPYVDDVSLLTYNAIKEGKNVLLEGAQATLLDLDFGTYPYVTSSHPVSGGFCTGAGIGPTQVGEIIGVAKAYTTRVGKGPFPTELFNSIGDDIRERGQEYGTTTGRPRRVGWFDAVILRYAARINGLTGLYLNKIDPLRGLAALKICVAYRRPDGTVFRDFPPAYEDLEGCEAVYETITGFEEDISTCRKFEDLPVTVRIYIERIEELCHCPVIAVGVGPSREQSILR
jgi:adenylosuccinate synthase